MKIVAFTLMVAASAAQAQYKCTATGGAVTYQQAACPITQTQRVLNARPAPADAASAPTAARSSAVPRKSVDERANATMQRDRRSNEFDQTLTIIEADFERLKALRTELEATRRLASR